jgi:HD superfamily phosphodiesterase
MTKKYCIDESHGIKHSMDVLNYAHEIYKSEIETNNFLKEQKDIIYISAIIHDLCDKKYVNETEGLEKINEFLNDKMDSVDITVVNEIISTMSYSKVKVNGFPNLGKYQLAYHIVREADLLTAYDFDRCMIYNMNKMNGNFEDAYKNSLELFEKRVFKHNDDQLFITNYSKELSKKLHIKAIGRINNWSKML